MNRLILTASALLVGIGIAPVAGAQAMLESSPYQVAPVSDATLAAASAGALPGGGNLRTLSDAQSKQYLGQVADVSRIAMDNWWAQTGADLITNNILASRPM